MESPFVGAAACSFWTRFVFLVWFFFVWCAVRAFVSGTLPGLSGEYPACWGPNQVTGLSV